MLDRLHPGAGAALATALIVLPATEASADEPNPAVVACQGKAEGAACTVQRAIKNNEGQHDTRDTPGTCRTEECCALDYAKGSPPETTCGPCLACKAGVPAPSPDPPQVAAPAGDAQSEPPRSETLPPPNGPNEKRGCSVGATSTGWIGLGLLWAGLVVTRRRRT